MQWLVEIEEGRKKLRVKGIFRIILMLTYQDKDEFNLIIKTKLRWASLKVWGMQTPILPNKITYILDDIFLYIFYQDLIFLWDL